MLVQFAVADGELEWFARVGPRRCDAAVSVERGENRERVPCTVRPPCPSVGGHSKVGRLGGEGQRHANLASTMVAVVEHQHVPIVQLLEEAAHSADVTDHLGQLASARRTTGLDEVSIDHVPELQRIHRSRLRPDHGLPGEYLSDRHDLTGGHRPSTHSNTG